MISCDEVFDVLTRGPFPTGRPSDGVVEAHLGRCADCQRLAEALRPAVELFEAVAPEESRTLPSYGGRLRSTAAPLPWEATLSEALPVVAKPELTRVNVPERQRMPASFLSGSCPVNLARFATAALLGAIIVGAAHQMGVPQLQAFAKRFQAANAGSELAQMAGLLKVDARDSSLYLSSNCLLPTPSEKSKDSFAGGTDISPLQLASAEGQANLIYNDKVCCLKCHSPDSSLMSPALRRATPLVREQCKICHPREPLLQ